ncbi:MAG: enoyl-ACP reductase [Phycisphaerales bacterium]
MGLMSGKKGLVIGVANDRSYAWHIAHSLKAHGAELMFTHLPGDKMERRVRSAVSELEIENPWLRPLDATDEAGMQSVFGEAAQHGGGSIDFLVHSIAFADKDYLEVGKFIDTPRDAYLQAVEVSAYTLLSMARAAKPHMSNGGSILGMTYYGAEKVVPGYNVMGVAKSALESTCRYLASDLGRSKIRVNTISGGPLKTLSAMGVGGFSKMLDFVESRAPLGRNIEGGEVGDTAVWLLSDLSTGVTGQNIFVDAGYCAMGM